MKGSAEQSYGIYVAKLAGIPNEILRRANVILEQLENKKENQNNASFPSITPKSNVDTLKQTVNSEELELLHQYKSIIKKIEELDLDHITPFDLYKHVSIWKDNAKRDDYILN